MVDPTVAVTVDPPAGCTNPALVVVTASVPVGPVAPFTPAALTVLELATVEPGLTFAAYPRFTSTTVVPFVIEFTV